MGGFQEGVLSFICGATDNAVYPSLFVSYLEQVMCPGDRKSTHVPCPALDDGLAWFLPSNRIIIIILAVCSMSYLNWKGLELVGKIAIGLTIFLLLPFAILVV